MNKTLNSLSDEQKKQVIMQLERHKHVRYNTDIALSNTKILKDFVVYPEILRPESMTSLFLARHLYQKQYLYKNKIVMDIGCGSGLQGIVMSIRGAKKVILSDISSQAVANAKENIKNFYVSDKATAIQSDLFVIIKETADLIVFNHPFFSAKPIQGQPVSISMLDSGKLIQKFLKESKKYLKKDGLIIMPYLELAGEINNPKIQGLKHNFVVSTPVHHDIKTGLQKGLISIYYLKFE